MKLHLDMLERVIELPSKDPDQLRQVLDDLGFEVKEIERIGERVVFTVETLANRADQAYVLGVARELCARNLIAVKNPPVVSDLGGRGASLSIRRNTDACSRYALLEMSLPAAMTLRPEVAAVLGGEDERHPIVHLSNYVLMELGQPTHAFDREKLEGDVIVDLTDREEEIEALDGKTYRVPPGSIVIRDRRKIVAIGGVIGCANSMVTASTTRVAIESASFDPVHVRKTARAMGISTDASFLFERGSDREAVVPALKRLAYLADAGAGMVRDAQGAHVLGFSIVEGEPVEKRRVTFRLDEIRRQMNLPRLKEVEIVTRLKNLGYAIEPSGDEKSLIAIVPSWRLWDVSHEQDIVEDFVRSHGLNKVKQELPPLDYEAPPLNDIELLREKLEPALLGSGFFEVITRSYYSADDAATVGRRDRELGAAHVTIQNALERNNSHLKVTNALHLARLLEENLRKGVLSAKVFEFTRLFHREQNEPAAEHEIEVLTLAVAGRWYANEWRRAESAEELLYLFKGVLEEMFRALGVIPVTETGESPVLHPGQQAQIRVGNAILGSFGAVHPELADALGLRHQVLYAEFRSDELLKILQTPKFEEPSDFPTIRRDITLKLGERQYAGSVLQHITNLQNPLIQDIAIVDAFKKPEEQFRRITYRITFQSAERTLEHEEADTFTSDILRALKDQHQIELA